MSDEGVNFFQMKANYVERIRLHARRLGEKTIECPDDYRNAQSIAALQKLAENLEPLPEDDPNWVELCRVWIASRLHQTDHARDPRKNRLGRRRHPGWLSTSRLAHVILTTSRDGPCRMVTAVPERGHDNRAGPASGQRRSVQGSNR
jgi:hypothetical protein